MIPGVKRRYTHLDLPSFPSPVRVPVFDEHPRSDPEAYAQIWPSPPPFCCTLSCRCCVLIRPFQQQSDSPPFSFHPLVEPVKNACPSANFLPRHTIRTNFANWSFFCSRFLNGVWSSVPLFISPFNELNTERLSVVNWFVKQRGAFPPTLHCLLPPPPPIITRLSMRSRSQRRPYSDSPAYARFAETPCFFMSPSDATSR